MAVPGVDIDRIEDLDIRIVSPSRATTPTLSSQDSSIQQTITAGQSDSVYKPKNIFTRFYGSLSVEPMLFLHMLAWSSTGVNVQAFYLQRICENEYAGSTSIDCTNLTENKTAEAHVEAIATTYSTFRNLIEAGLPVIFSLFIGPWSDKHGSKYTMILPLIGYILSTVLLYMFSMVDTVDPGILLLASVPIALSGGVVAFILSAFKYVAAASATEVRSFRMAVAEGSWFLGGPIGLLGSAALFKYNGYQLVFLCCLIIYTMATLYALFLVKNDKPEDDGLGSITSCSSICSDMFNLEAVKDTFRTTFGPRAGSERMWILLLLGAMYLRIFTLCGNITVNLLYTRQMFKWDTPSYSAYVTCDGIIGLVGSATVAVLGMKYYKVADAKIGVLSSISYLGGSIVWLISGFTALSWMMYLGATVQMFCGLITIMSRSMLSKVVHKDEIGKVYSIAASGEAAVPLIAAPVYNYIYSESVSFFPSLPFALTTFLNAIVAIIFIYFSTLNSSVVQHEHLEEEADTHDEDEP